VGLLSLVLAAAAALAPPSADVSATPALHGARPVALTLRLHYDMQCNYPGPGPVTIRLPAALRVPRRLDHRAVLVDGKPSLGAALAGHVVTVELAPPPPVLCMVIAPGTLTIRFTAAARLGNPLRAGSYRVAAQRRELAFAATLRIR
jgi:hypothetical protein